MKRTAAAVLVLAVLAGACGVGMHTRRCYHIQEIAFSPAGLDFYQITIREDGVERRYAGLTSDECNRIAGGASYVEVRGR